MKFLNGNNYQIKGEWRNEEGYSLFGYAETKAEAQKIVTGLSRREDCEHIAKWIIIDRRRDKYEEYKPIEAEQ